MQDENTFNFRRPFVGGGEFTPKYMRPQSSNSPVATSGRGAPGRTQANAYHYLRRYGE